MATARSFADVADLPLVPFPGALTVQQVTDVDGFRALRTAWNELHARSNPDAVVTTWEWLFSWWEVFGAGRGLRIVLAYDGDRLVGIAPLQLHTTREHGVPVRRLELLGMGEAEADEILSEYLDFVLEPGREAEIGAAIWSHLAATSDWDDLRITSHLEASPLAAAIRAAAGAAPVAVELRPRTTAVLVPLAADPQAFLAAQSKSMREDLKRHRKLLDKVGPVTLERAGTLDELRAMLPVFVDLHQRLWESRGKPGCFASPRFTAFHAAVSERMFERGLVDLYLFRVGGRAVAGRYSFHIGSRMLEYQSGLDPTFEPKISTGSQCAHACILDAIARGFSSYDLGEGPRPYKLRWTHELRPTVELCVTRRTARTRVAHLAGLAIAQLRAVKRRVRPTLPHSGSPPTSV